MTAIPLFAADFRTLHLMFMPYIIKFLAHEMHVVLAEQTKEDLTSLFSSARKPTILFN